MKKEVKAGPRPKQRRRSERSVKCGNCGTINPFGAITCSKCGYARLNLVVREGNRVQEYD